MTVPGNTKDGLFQRMPLEIPLRPPHELMEEEIEADSSLMLKLQESIADGKQPPAYRNHPVVAGSTTPVLPYALYMDGVSYSLVDSVIGMWLVPLVSGARHLIGLIRKQKNLQVRMPRLVQFLASFELPTLVLRCHGKRRAPNQTPRWPTFRARRRSQAQNGRSSSSVQGCPGLPQG